MFKAMKTLQVLLLVTALFVAVRAQAAVDAFIVFGDPSGGAEEIATETTDKYIKDNLKDLGTTKLGICNVKSVSFGITNQFNIGSASGGAGAGKVKFDDVSVTMDVGLSMNKLFLTCAKGGSYKKVFLVYRKAGGTTKTLKPYYIIELSDVFVSNLKLDVSGDEPPGSTVTLNFGAVKISYWKQKADGTLAGSPIVMSWNQVTNTK